MKLTLPHQTTQQETINKIENKLNELLAQKFPGIAIIDPIKEWEDNIMRFSFAVAYTIFTLEFSGILIVTDQEAILEGDLPHLLTKFVSEEKVREIITKEFNNLFNIRIS